MKIKQFLKWSFKSVVLGLLILFVFNLIGVYLNINIPINIWTVLFIGIFRIPGLAAILIYMLV